MRRRPAPAQARAFIMYAMSLLSRTASAATLALLLLTGCAATPASSTPPATAAPVDLDGGLRALEETSAARIGVSAIDTGTGKTVSYRSEERFGYASSIKALLAAGFLATVPTTERERVMQWTAEDVEAAGYSPFTSEHIAEGATLSRLAEAAVRESDNTAANLVFDSIGGPAGLRLILENAGDRVTRVVHEEPLLNVVVPGSDDDTTTPAAFTADLERFLTGDALTETDRSTLVEWMTGNASGDPLIRTGAPEGWTVADKSGGAGPMRNDIAIVTPPDREPILLSILTVKIDPEADYENTTVSEAARVVLDALR